MLLSTDVAYARPADGPDEVPAARAAGLRFEAWDSAGFVDAVVECFSECGPYVSGEFYRRELPCIWPLVVEARRRGPLDVVIVDGFVDLGPDRPGLGRHLFDRIVAQGWSPIAVVGVAKTPFRGASGRPVNRGESQIPLWVSAAGMPLADAVAAVTRMDGEFRLPTMIKWTDQLANGVTLSPAPPPESSSRE